MSSYCPACAGKNARRLLPVRLRAGKDRFLNLEIRHCPDCDHRFLPTTAADQAIIEEKYEGEYAGFRVDPFFDARVRQEIDERIVPLHGAPGKVLDVGCGNGAFMAAMQDRGYSVQGIDVSHSGVEHCRGLGLDAVCADFLSHDFGTTFDIITMWDVLEHLREPEAFLTRAWSLLAPGGVLVLKVPGFERMAFPLIRLDARFAHIILSAPGHVQYFNRRSLGALLARCGMHDVRWWSLSNMRKPAPPKSLRNSVLRFAGRSVRSLSGSRNLFVAARRDPGSAQSAGSGSAAMEP